MSQPPTSDYRDLPRSAADHHADAIGHAARAEQLEKMAREEWRAASRFERLASFGKGSEPWDPEGMLRAARYDLAARDYLAAIDTATVALSFKPDKETAQDLHELIVRARGLVGGAP